MSPHFPHSRTPTKVVKYVQFGVLSPEETIALSVARIEHVETFERNLRKVGGLLDPRMGCVDKTDRCATCRSGTEGCPGHFGHIELARPVYHVGWQFIRVKKILETVCYHCSKIRLCPTVTQVVHGRGNEAQTTKTGPRDKYVEMMRLRKTARFQFAWRYGKARKVCEWKDCGRQLLPLKKVRNKLQFDSGHVLEAGEAYGILRNISDEDWSSLGMDPANARPEWMILTVLPVPPPAVRPSINMEGNGRGEDDLTHKLSDVIKYNELVRNPPDSNTKIAMEHADLLQYHVTTYIDNDVRGNDAATQKGGRPLRSLKSRLKGKEGRFRNNLMGKRVDFSARTVITGDPNLNMNQVGVPQVIAENLTFPETACDLNIARLQTYVNNRSSYPGAKYLIQDGRRRDLRFGSNPAVVNIGDTVERHLTDGDIVVFNRQPSLHKMSMMGHRVKVMPYSTFRLNLSVTTPYNADFDGDEMNLHVPQSWATRAEIMHLAMVPDLIVSPQSNRPVCGIVQDALLGIYLLTGRDTMLDREAAMDLRMHLPDIASSWALPPPAIMKPRELWTGKQLFSMLLPDSLSYNGYHSAHPEGERMDHSPGDTKVTIVRGDLLAGIICKRAIGPTGGGLVHMLWQDEGGAVVETFMNGCQTLANQFLMRSGFSVAIGDGMISQGGLRRVTDTVLGADKASTDNVTRDSAGKQAQLALNRGNNFRRMVAAGSKGSSINISQIAACVGPQNVEGKGIPRGFRNRTLPHFDEFDESPSARGFVMNSYSRGLNPSEFFFHAMGGREGIIDTAVKSVTWDTEIVIIDDGVSRKVRIGEWIDCQLAARPAEVRHFDARHLEMLDLEVPVMVPTMDANGTVSWGSIVAVTRHDPGDRLYRVTTEGGRSVTVTESKSLLVWKASSRTFCETETPLIRVGDFVPAMAFLPLAPETSGDYMDLIQISDDGPARINDVFLDAISSIEVESPAADEKVYDVTVPETFNFGLANGLQVRDTAETGYLQRKLVKALEDAMVCYDNLVRNGRGNVLQWIFGEDGMDGTAIEKQSLQTILLSNQEIRERYAGDAAEYAQLIKDRDALRVLIPTMQDSIALPTNLKRILIQATSQFPVSLPLNPPVANGCHEVAKLLLTLNRHGLSFDSVYAAHLRSVLATRQLQYHRVSEDAFSWMVGKIERKYLHGLVHPGEMVGVVAAQSIGEPATQLTLNTFHLAGVGSKKLTLGIPRLKELLNTSQNIRTPSMTLYTAPGYLDDCISKEVQLARLRYLKAEIEHVALEHVVETVQILHDPEFVNGSTNIAADVQWVELLLAIPDDTNPDWSVVSPWMIRLVLDRARVWEHCLIMAGIVASIQRDVGDDAWCISSDDNDSELVIHFRVLVSDQECMPMEIYLRQLQDQLMAGVTLKGVRGVSGVTLETHTVPTSDADGNIQYVKEMAIETEGINIAEICALPDIDGRRIQCNNPVEVLQFLGVEAARAVLLKEIRKVIEFDGSYINVRHLMLLCDVMTTSGNLMAITRHGINRTDAGPLAKSSFEETNDILFNAAADSERDSMQGVSESLIFGQMARLGTGTFEIIERCV